MNFQDELKGKTKEAWDRILPLLPKEEGHAAAIASAMNYSMKSPGKRLRPVLMLETYRVFGGRGKEIDCFLAGIEMIHAHSLVHDDLPALDNDDLRRGRATTHRVYGEAMAILAGDALLNLAYETMLGAFDLAQDPLPVAKALQVMASKTGLYGMLGGQSYDVENDGRPLTGQMLDVIYTYKTSSLLEASMMAGAILAGACEEEVKDVRLAAADAGLAFQIMDDILDVTSTREELGKPIHSDEKNHKTTYVTLYGLEESRKKCQELSARAADRLASLGRDCSFLESLIRYLAERKH